MISFATKTLKAWVDEQEMIGHWTFSYDEALVALSRFSNAALSSELNRLVTAGRIACVHRGKPEEGRALPADSFEVDIEGVRQDESRAVEHFRQ